jgi:predicted aspartyl protease
VRNKTVPTPVLFGDKGSEILLGAITLEELGFSVDPIHRTLIPATAYLLSLF